MTVLTGTAALAGTVALWALDFGSAHSLTVRHVEETSDPIYASRHAGDALTVMVAGLMPLAVANEMVISHPHRHTPAALSLLLHGGPILFLVALGWHSWFVLRIWPRWQDSQRWPRRPYRLDPGRGGPHDPGHARRTVMPEGADESIWRFTTITPDWPFPRQTTDFLRTCCRDP